MFDVLLVCDFWFYNCFFVLFAARLLGFCLIVVLWLVFVFCGLVILCGYCVIMICIVKVFCVLLLVADLLVLTFIGVGDYEV